MCLALFAPGQICSLETNSFLSNQTFFGCVSPQILQGSCCPGDKIQDPRMLENFLPEIWKEAGGLDNGWEGSKVCFQENTRVEELRVQSYTSGKVEEASPCSVAPWPGR